MSETQTRGWLRGAPSAEMAEPLSPDNPSGAPVVSAGVRSTPPDGRDAARELAAKKWLRHTPDGRLRT